MALAFLKSRLCLFICILTLPGCSQQPEVQEQTIISSETSQGSGVESMYQMANEHNASCLQSTDSLLQSTNDPNSRAEAFYIKGLYYSNIKDIPKALQYFDSTIKENFTFFNAYIEKGILLNEKGDFENALTTLEIASEMTKNNADLYYWMGRSNEGLKKIKNAITFYKMTIQVDPTYQAAEAAIKRLNK